MRTEVEVGNDVFVDPVSEVFAPLGAADESVLNEDVIDTMS